MRRITIRGVGKISLLVLCAALALMMPASSAVADTFGSGANTFQIDFVTVGNPGNAGWVDDPYAIGAVSYSYRIAKYEVTNAQYVDFLNAVDSAGANVLSLYNSNMSTSVFGGINYVAGAGIGSKYAIKSGRDKNPVAFVSWYDAIRFTNWLHNGQGASDTEDGAYTIQGGTPTPSNGLSIVRNPGAKWWLPSEDEWFKAGFHKNDGITGNYWSFATSSNDFPFSVPPPGSAAPMPSNTGNFYRDDRTANGFNNGYAVTGSTMLDGSQNYLTDVGAYALAVSPYGTFDQAGNVYEWNEFQSPFATDTRGIRGGSWRDGGDLIYGLSRGGVGAIGESQYIGFRVAGIIPEPSTLLLLGAGFVGLLSLRRRLPHKWRYCDAQHTT